MEEDSSSDVVWTRDQMLRLIDLFRDRPLLWDHTSPLFKDKHKKHVAWQEIALDLKLTKLEVQAKMRILIIQFKRESKKLRSGAGARDGKCKWFAFERLLFLKDARDTPRDSKEALVAGNLIEDNTSQEPFLDQGMLEVEIHSAPGTNKRSWSPNSNYLPSPKRSASSVKLYTSTDEDAFQEMHSFGKHFKPKDEFDIFGELVACQLRKSSDPRERAMAKQRINQVLFDLEMSNLKNPSTSPTTSSRCSDHHS